MAAPRIGGEPKHSAAVTPMTLREYYAGIAFQCILSRPGPLNDGYAAQSAVRCADALIAALAGKGG